jgi:putative methyltransferase (TIGR04325 family)
MKMNRKFVSDFVPPVFSRYFSKVKKYGIRQKLYNSYEEAFLKCKTKGGYEEEELIKVILAKTKVFKERLELEPFFNCDHVNANILMCFGCIVSNTKLNVIDIGGACGAHYFIIKKVYGDKIKLNWNIVETPRMCAYGKPLENEEMKFYDDLQEATVDLGSIDLIFSSSTIPYLKDPRRFLGDVTSIGADYILLTRLSFTAENNDIISIQKSRLKDNGIGPLPQGFKDSKVYYPHTNMIEKDFMDIVTEKYKVKIKFNEKSGIHYVNNSSITGYGILLQKK